MTPNVRAIGQWLHGMFSRKTKRCPVQIAERLVRETYFSQDQLDALYKRFCHFAAKKSRRSEYLLSREQFFKMHAFTSFPLYSLIFDIMFGTNKDLEISFLDLIKYLSLFEASNLCIPEEHTLKIRMRKFYLLFNFLDDKDDDILDRTEMAKVVCKLNSRTVPEQTFLLNMLDLIVGVMNELDLQTLNFKNFCQIVQHMRMEECLLVF